MINTEFGRLVATGAALFVFALVMSYLKIRMQTMAGARRPAPKPARPSAVPVR